MPEDAHGMEADRPESPEQWTQDENVREVLGCMLAVPLGDHRAVVASALAGHPFANAPAAALYCLVASIDFKKPQSRWGAALAKSKAAAYHTWLYHFLDGASENLVAPPACLGCTTFSNKLLERARPDYSSRKKGGRFWLELDSLRSAATRGTDDANAKLKHLRWRDVSKSELRDPEASNTNNKPKQAAAANPNPTPADPAEAELGRRAASCLALAMGTHGRLGVVSGVRLLVGEHDVLRLIARHAGLRTTDWLPRPPPKEVATLRRHLVLEHGELLLTREQLNDANVIIKSLMVANERARRQLEYAERHTSEADHRAKTIHEEVTAWKQLW